MDFSLNDEQKMVQQTVRDFVNRELLPLEDEMSWKSYYIHTMGDWGPASLYFEDVCVPETNILGELHNGFDLGMQWIGADRWRIPASAVGRRAGAAKRTANRTLVSPGAPVSHFRRH